MQLVLTVPNSLRLQRMNGCAWRLVSPDIGAIAAAPCEHMVRPYRPGRGTVDGLPASAAGAAGLQPNSLPNARRATLHALAQTAAATTAVSRVDSGSGAGCAVQWERGGTGGSPGLR